jgi:hypothetical protein
MATCVPVTVHSDFQAARARKAAHSMNILPVQRLALRILAFISFASIAPAQPAPNSATASPVEIVLVETEAVKPAAVAQWKKEGFKAVAPVLDERPSEAVCREVARQILDGGLELYWWIEVGRNPRLAEAHPRWMAALGMHEDWQKNFPNIPEPKAGEVAKAFPWVPIGYREAFDAHLARLEQLLKRVPPGWRGLLLNDLQGGPSSCGCGNLQCRWAIDYGVRPTATKMRDDFVAVRFLAEVRKRTGDKLVIPVWTTECTDVDLPADKNHGRPGTGLCGTVGCATGACPKTFAQQWSALATESSGPIAILALHAAFQRTEPAFGGGPGWVTNAIGYLNQTLPANGGKTVRADQLWAVVQGSADEEAVARKMAAQTGAAAVIVARAKIDQSYEPRMVSTK